MEDFTVKTTNSIMKEDSDDQVENNYTLSGLEEFSDDDNYPRLKETENKNVFAKKISRKNGSIKYMIKVSSNGKFYNPVSIYGIEEQKTFLDKICRSNNKFKEVNNKVFSLYLKFLTSKNPSWLSNAEREAE